MQFYRVYNICFKKERLKDRAPFYRSGSGAPFIFVERGAGTALHLSLWSEKRKRRTFKFVERERRYIYCY